MALSFDASRPTAETGSAADRIWWFQSADEPRRPPRRPRRRWSRRGRLDALACLTLSALWFSQAGREMLFRADGDVYNRVPLGAPVLTAMVLNLIALAAVGSLGVHALRRARRPLWRRLGAVAAAATVLIALNSAMTTYGDVGGWAGGLGGPGRLTLAALALAASLAWPRPALRAARALALVLCPVALVTLAFAAWMFLELAAGPVWVRVGPEPLERTPPSLRRVVWLVFEELDQRVTFEARPAGLELPELDRLRRESLYADGARPPAGATELTMPALITGRPVVAVAPLGPNELGLTFADGTKARFSAHPNVFARARTLGYDGALIGWKLPYPRVLGGSLGLADFRPAVTHESVRGETFAETSLNLWAGLWPSLHRRRLAAQRFADLADLGLRAATDGRFGLVLLHLPVPMPPAIYDRTSGRLTPWNFRGAGEGYLDNLVLADRMIERLRHGLDRARLDDRTWLVVTSSRPWANPYDGQVDRRVPFLVRPPDGGRATHVDMPFNTLAAHDLVLAILRGSVADTRDAAAWLARQPVAPPKEVTSGGRPVY